MNMVRLHLQFQLFNPVFLLAKSIDLLLDILHYLLLEHPIPILRTENYMTFTLVYRMGQFLESVGHCVPPRSVAPSRLADDTYITCRTLFPDHYQR